MMPPTTDIPASPSGVSGQVDPIEYTTKRFKCPFCRWSRAARKPVLAHMARCWANPAARGCKTCVFFVAYSPASDEPEHCVQGVDLTAPCKACRGGEGWWEKCDLCGGTGKQMDATQPVVGCPQWEAA